MSEADVVGSEPKIGADHREQHWYCEKCDTTGSMTHDEHADVMSVVHQVGDDHKRVSPNCGQPTGYIRILNPNIVH